MVQHYIVVKADFHCKNRVVSKKMPLKWCNITLHKHSNGGLLFYSPKITFS